MSFDQTRLPRAYTIFMDPNHTWTLVADAPLHALAIEPDGTHAVNVKLNGDTAASFQLAGAGVIFSYTDREFDVTSVTITRPPSASGTATIQVFASCLGTSPTATLV